MAKIIEKINGEAYIFEWKPMDITHLKNLGVNTEPEETIEMLEYLKAFYFLALRANDRSMSLEKAEDFMNDVMDNYECEESHLDLVEQFKKQIGEKVAKEYHEEGLIGLEFLSLLAMKIQSKSNQRQKPSFRK